MRLTRLSCLLSLLLALCAALNGAPSRAQTRLTIWHTWQPAQAALLEAWLADYAPIRDGELQVDVRYVPLAQLATQLSDPTLRPPDAILSVSDALAQPAVRRFAAALDRNLTPELRQALTPLAWQLAEYDRRTLALPLALESYALYVNRALVQAEPPSTLRALAAQAAEHGLILPRDFYPTAGMFFALNGALLDEDGNSALSVNALGNYLIALRTLAQGEGVLLGAPEDRFRAGEVGYLLAGSWRLPTLRAALGERLGVIALPSVEGRVWRPVARAWQLYLGLGSPFRMQSLDLWRHLVSESAQARAPAYGFLPVLPTAAVDSPLSALASALYSAGVPLPNRPELAALWLPLRRAINAVLDEGSDPLAAAAEAVARAAEGIAALRAQ
ncbi:MAG: extracellular solute-binding protein [Chloroflexi bacterium]|nr:extracellular solute-binding protein [Chloroflexota bacterium]